MSDQPGEPPPGFYPVPPDPSARRPTNPGGLSSGVLILIGAVVGPIVLGGVATCSLTVVSLITSALHSDLIDGVLSLMATLVVPMVIVAGLVWPKTRWLTLGAIIGSALLFIVLAGVCVALLAGMGN